MGPGIRSPRRCAWGPVVRDPGLAPWAGASRPFGAFRRASDKRLRLSVPPGGLVALTGLDSISRGDRRCRMLAMPEPTDFDLRFRLLGIPVRVHPLFWLVTAIMGYDQHHPRLTLIWIVCVFVSILV